MAQGCGIDPIRGVGTPTGVECKSARVPGTVCTLKKLRWSKLILSHNKVVVAARKTNFILKLVFRLLSPVAIGASPKSSDKLERPLLQVLPFVRII